MTNYYYMNNEMGNLVTMQELWQDAEENGYEDILDPTSILYGMWQEHYTRIAYVAEG